MRFERVTLLLAVLVLLLEQALSRPLQKLCEPGVKTTKEHKMWNQEEQEGQHTAHDVLAKKGLPTISKIHCAPLKLKPTANDSPQRLPILTVQWTGRLY
jgi:hypothetical protein